MKVLRSLRGGRDVETQARLDQAVAAVDRELAANLELTTMFDQTHQPVVLENGEFGRYRMTIERDLAAMYAPLADLYARIPEIESAMERRGPAASLATADRAIVETWEGDARALQRALRAALRPPRSVLGAIFDRLRGKATSVR